MGSVFKPKKAAVTGAQLGALPPLTRASLQAWLQRPRVDLKAELPAGKLLVLNCAAGLEPQASVVLEMVRRALGGAAIERVHSNPDSPLNLPVGPGPVILRPSPLGAACAQPDYMGPDASGETRDMTVTCLALGLHVQLELATGISCPGASLLDAILVDEGALDEQTVLLRRNQPEFEGHSGWYLLGLSGLRDDPDYQPVAVYELLKRRPGLIAPLGMPEDFIARFEGEQLAEIVDSNNRPVYRPS